MNERERKEGNHARNIITADTLTFFFNIHRKNRFSWAKGSLGFESDDEDRRFLLGEQ